MATLASGPLTGFVRRLTLRTALKLDAVVSGTNGAAYLVAAGPLGDVLGLEPVLLRILGAVLVAFAAALMLTATRAAVARPAVVAIVVANAAWAVAGIVVALGGWVSPTTLGTVWIVAQALVVAGFAELQATASRR